MGSSNQMAARHRASTVGLETADSRRWSSVSEYSSRTRTPAIPTYTEALIRSSQRLRERSMSPPPALPPMEKVSPYKYNMNNLTRIKRRFSSIVQDRWGRDSTPDPLKPSRNTSEVYEPIADKLAIKHKSIPYGPHPLPYIYVYHRS